jgi:hypothetical protein
MAHNKDWLWPRDQHSEELLCERDAGMVESRDTSRQEAGMRPRSPER